MVQGQKEMEQIKYDDKATRELACHDSYINHNGYSDDDYIIDLLKQGANPNIICDPHCSFHPYPFTSMEWAITNARDKVIEVMFEKGAVVTTNTYKAFLYGHFEDKCLIENGYWDSQKYPHTIVRIPFRNSVVIGRILLEHGLDPDSHCDTKNIWPNSYLEKTFREFLEQKCQDALIHAKYHEEANFLKQEVENYQHALEKVDKLWNLDIVALNSEKDLIRTIIDAKLAINPWLKRTIQQEAIPTR